MKNLSSQQACTGFSLVPATEHRAMSGRDLMGVIEHHFLVLRAQRAEDNLRGAGQADAD